MKDFLYGALIEPFTDGEWIGWLMGVLMWAITLFLAGMILWFSVWLIDSSFLPKKEGTGTITNKYIVPAYTTITFMHTGKTTIPVTTYHSTTYNITIAINGLSDDVSVYESDYNYYSVGQKLHCRYTNGRILNSMYVKDILP